MEEKKKGKGEKEIGEEGIEDKNEMRINIREIKREEEKDWEMMMKEIIKINKRRMRRSSNRRWNKGGRGIGRRRWDENGWKKNRWGKEERFERNKGNYENI